MQLFKTPRFFRIFFPNKTWGFSSSKNAVYLTFDDGPDPKITPWVLDYLKENGIQATFFCVGENVRKHPDLYKRILEEGHRTGNHTMYHQRGTKTSLNEYVRSVEQAAEYINSDLFRPPYGRMTIAQTRKLKKKYQIIMWSWLSFDFDRKIENAKIIRKAKRQIQSGDILVFHDNAKTEDRLKILLPEIVRILERKDLEFRKIDFSTSYK